jgi:SAM-dependent methyltransferase
MPHSHDHDASDLHEGVGHTHDHDSAELESDGADLLDLDAQVLHGYWDAALDLATAALSERAARAERSPARVVDLGAGTGTGALGLARRLPDAEVVAVDVSELSLARIGDKARAAGTGDRVRTLVADLDAGWPDLGPVDLTWASMSLHHLADPTRSLSELRRMTRTGGLVAVAEFDEPLRFLPDDLGVGRPGFETRALDALSVVHAEAVPTLGAPWASILGDAGWTVTGQHDLVIDEPSPEHPLAGRYARGWFADRLDAEDRLTLTTLLGDGPLSLLRRTDLHLRGVRTVTVAHT